MGSRPCQIALQFAALSLLVSGLGCPPASVCGSGTDVRDVDDSAVANATKQHILWEPGSINGRYFLSDQSDVPVPNPEYPNGKIVVIRVQPEGLPANTAVTEAYVNEVFFNIPSWGETPSRSVAGYYLENSYGKFLCTSAGVPDWASINSLASYGDVESSIPFLRHTLRSSDVDWPTLDVNGDDVISRAEAQIVILIPNGSMTSGYASKRSRTIGSTPTPSGWYDFGTRPIVYFSVKAESISNSHFNAIRYHAALVHELHHAFFDLPDRYGSNSGTGSYDPMSASRDWIYMTMFDKMKIGWVQPRIVNFHIGSCVRFAPSGFEDAALVLVKPDSMTMPGDPLEYWVIENRNRAYTVAGYDDELPEDGLAVWYVCEGTYSSGHDDVRLVNASWPDRDPNMYKNPYADALFQEDPDNPKRLLLDAGGSWSLLFFDRVSIPGYYAYAEF